MKAEINTKKYKVFFIKTLKIVIFTYTIFCLLIYFYQEKIIFLPIKDIINPDYNNHYQIINLETDDKQRIEGWFLSNKSDKVILFLHGNGGNISYNEERFSICYEFGINCFMIDYRGYGNSNGKIKKEQDLYTDAKAAYDFLIQRGFKEENIILWGQSLGGAIAIDLSQNKNFHTTIIESTFFSMEEMAKKQYPILPTSFLLKYKFKNNEKVANIKSRVIFMHSTADEMIDYSNSKRLYDIVKGEKEFINIKGSHNGGYVISFNVYKKMFSKILTHNLDNYEKTNSTDS